MGLGFRALGSCPARTSSETQKGLRIGLDDLANLFGAGYVH